MAGGSGGVRDGAQADEWDSEQLEVVDFPCLVYFRQGEGS